MGKKLWLFITCALISTSMAFAQKSVTGLVIDKSSGEPLLGVHVKANGQAVAITDADGKFTIKNLPANAKVLDFSYLGYDDAQAVAKNNVRVAMSPATKKLDEVMVIAYGSQKKNSFTGSATEIKAEQIEGRIATDFTSALAGNTPGLQMTSSSGDPAADGNSIRIRGFGSMSAGSSPLIVLDGAPYDGSLNSINPQDIESVTVLKDAASTAIYGARGGNGVILVTTKKGNKQDAEIKFDARWGSNSRLIPQYDIITDPGQYYELTFKQLYNTKKYYGSSHEEAYAYANRLLYDADNGGLGYKVFTVPEGQNLIGENLRLNPNATLGYKDSQYTYLPDDWYDEAYHNSFRQEYNISASGMTDRLNYYVSGGYLDDGGIVNNSNFKRYTGRMNADYRAKEWLTVKTSMSYTHSEGKRPYTTSTFGSSGNMFYICNNIAPIYPLYVRDVNGNIMHDDNGMTIYDANQTNFKRANFTGNAVRDNEVDRHNFQRDMFNGNWAIVITPIEGLKLTANLSAMNNNFRRTDLSSRFGNSVATDGSVEVTTSRTLSVNNQYLANYTTDFGTDGTHNFDIVAGYEQYRYTYQYFYGWNTHLYDPFIAELGNALGAETNNLSSYTDRLMTEGFLGRAQYDYKETYFVSASIRRDASSRFAPGHRWGTFGSVGAAWLMNKEKWFDVNWVDELKLKASYGSQGNDDLGYYPYATTYNTSYNSETGDYSITLNQKGNDELTWEKIKSFNLGAEFSLFKGRLYGGLEFFVRNTSDMLYYKDLPLSTGITGTYPINVGSMRNTGIEFNVEGVIMKKKDLNWTANLNLTHYKNKITELDPSVSENGIISSTRIIKEGGSLYEGYMLKYAGVNPENGKAQYWTSYQFNEDGTIKKDDNGKYIQDESNCTKTEVYDYATKFDVGTTLPDLFGGFGTTLKFYGFDFSANFQFQLGGKYYDGVYQRLMHTQASAGTAWHKDILDAWTEDNPNTDIPRLDGATDSQYALSQATCDRFQVSASYLSINNVTLGYTFPKTLLSAAGISALRVYVAGENLAVLAARKGIDPRYSFGIGGYTSGSGMNSDSYSARRTITAGLTLSF